MKPLGGISEGKYTTLGLEFIISYRRTTFDDENTEVNVLGKHYIKYLILANLLLYLVIGCVVYLFV